MPSTLPCEPIALTLKYGQWLRTLIAVWNVVRLAYLTTTRRTWPRGPVVSGGGSAVCDAVLPMAGPGRWPGRGGGAGSAGGLPAADAQVPGDAGPADPEGDGAVERRAAAGVIGDQVLNSDEMAAVRAEVGGVSSLEAQARREQARTIATRIASLTEEARALEGIGQCHLQNGPPDQGAASLRQALAICHRIGSANARRVQQTLVGQGI